MRNSYVEWVAVLVTCTGCSSSMGTPNPAAKAQPEAGALSLDAGHMPRDASLASEADADPDVSYPPMVDPGCSAEITDAALEPRFSFASGVFSGIEMSGSVCRYGALARFESAQGGQSDLLFVLDDNFDNPATNTNIHFDRPRDATSGGLVAVIGVAGASRTGVYTNANTCGGVGLIADLPVTVDCPPTSGPCPPGCVLQGPTFATVCRPLTPKLSYQATAASDCVGGVRPARGSWALTVTSAEPVTDRYGLSDLGSFVVHGHLTSQLVGVGDGGAPTVDLSLWF